jgi:hypothetical protein
LGIVEEVIGGFLANLFRDAGVTNLNLYSFFVAFVGAAAFLIIYHARSIVGNIFGDGRNLIMSWSITMNETKSGLDEGGLK